MKVEQHILDVAEDLFNRNGYNSVGVDLIRDEAKVSKTTIYRRFGDKVGLVEAVLTRRHDRFQASLEEAVCSVKSSEDKVFAILDWHFEWFSLSHFEGCMFMHALAEFKRVDQSISGIALEHKRWLLELIRQALGVETEQYYEKSEMIMTFIEGLIVRAEFDEVLDKKELYRAALMKIIK
ncbi:TetR/AcrR family transcriptional regulator [Pseudoalteromonas sp. MMG013]|uniref:TetR/AcrR family transcriptional regulator n=1 Tax=unclassified Pseudoalteromonas TaxID=194690 RepID=UPI001B373DBF|nr:MULTISPECIES: TetR/AcrR family transcriptional regulator [unclassified Pseudoalteromonas]MBQ4848367.1 TetR/AcrR family transcriptional regulator [Pseudoalteromonas sp. MMG005]MBQ4864219.1 TetR/AcrR family transcriptional regulator [Pseudoalteromonas sp. MMG013]